MKRHLFILLFLLHGYNAICQNDMLIEEMTSALMENGSDSDAEQIHEMLTELSQSPIDINSSSESTMNQSGLFSPFQVYEILRYREKYGTFYSIYELAALPGFNVETLKKLTPFLSVSSRSSSDKYFRNRGYILSNVMIKYPKTLAYENNDSGLSAYTGSAFKITHRLKYEIGKHWTFGAAYEKDPGERWTHDRLPEHMAGYIQYNSDRFIKQIVLGNYRLHRGLGLVHGLGFNSRSNGVMLDGFRQSYAKAFSSTSEYEYFRGIYAEAGLKNWRSDIFFSHQSKDMSFFNLESNPDLFERIRETGLHRTKTELNGIGLGRERTAGLSINRSFSHANIGFSSTISSLGLSSSGEDSISFLQPGNKIRSNYSIYGVGFGNNFELYTEIAINQMKRFAMLIGGTYKPNPALKTSISLRRYQPGYTAPTPNAFGSGSSPENETGLNIGLTLVPIPNARLMLNTDISKELYKMTTENTSNFDVYNSIRIEYNWSNGSRLEFRIVEKLTDELIDNNKPGNGITQNDHITRYRLHLDNKISDRFKASSRFEISRRILPKQTSTGTIIYQQVNFSPSDIFSLSYRFLIFNSEDWENRIYTYEPGVRYSFQFPAMHGSGSRNILITKLKINRWFTMRGKIGLTHFAHTHSKGSGNDLREGDKVFDIEIQFQLDF